MAFNGIFDFAPAEWLPLQDQEMLDLFVNALKAKPNNLVEGRHFSVSGLDVFVTWQ